MKVNYIAKVNYIVKVNYVARRSVINFTTLSAFDLAGLQEETLFNLHSYYLFLLLQKKKKDLFSQSLECEDNVIVLLCSTLLLSIPI